jgi:hypothetical protein
MIWDGISASDLDLAMEARFILVNGAVFWLICELVTNN